MADHPLEECAKSAEKLIENGHQVYQKFTCEKCGSRQTIDEPNVFYTSGKCEECSHTTNIKEKGCNYLSVFTYRR
jgi:DNA-directed RNA polymerase subunit RPC12/RpoP